ncbi:MAG: AAA family ATPase [Thaumarchaeota archaeon]|nr:AAA family ATPase [Nitrososphaerota archaeon]
MKPRKKSSKISVVISGMPSVGKTTAAEAVAKKFHLLHLAGGDMLKQMALEMGYRPSGSDWWDSPQGMAFLAARKKTADFDKEVDRRLIENVRSGGVVITSYPVPWITKFGLKIWFAASPKTRAKRLAGRDSIAVEKALKIIRKRDSKNRLLYKKIYGIRFGDDLTPFNYIVDTERMDAAAVAKVTCKLVSEYRRGRKNNSRGSKL